MRLSQYFLPTVKEDPAEAQIVSHKLMLRAGMIRQASAGIYSWLPLGLRVLKKVEKIVREEQDVAGAQEILMPTIQSAELWKESGRYNGYGKEMLRILDRHQREMLYGPTNEELITDIFRQTLRSYKDLPKILYHIQWKFRDEVRPRFGVMRGREFLMKDSYSFDIDKIQARQSYNRMFVSYLRTFAKLGLRAIPMQADTGPIGGNLSHEFIILAETGESEVFCDKKYLNFDPLPEKLTYENNLEKIVERWTSEYAATDEKHIVAKEKELGSSLLHARGIEVGHIFYFGKKYSKAMGVTIAGPKEEPIIPEMGSYGIGVSRLVGAIIEASHDHAGIIWPDTVSPFSCGILNLRINDQNCCKTCEDLAIKLEKCGHEVLYDDRDETAGNKFAVMDLVGLPWQIVVGPRGLKNGVVELKRRDTGERNELSIDSIIEKLSPKN
ncbi:MAG: proline--tRNA ligase [Pseudomonadota bacterium]|nr:proline--tRNA ligase [Pseudomonadota bacterium]